jgi:hypothetical protein
VACSSTCLVSKSRSAPALGTGMNNIETRLSKQIENFIHE